MMHVQFGDTVCGDSFLGDEYKSCHRLQAGAWSRLPFTLEFGSTMSSVWETSDGAYILGGMHGDTSSQSVDILRNEVKPGFDLAAHTMSACAISFEEFVVVTGGDHPEGGKSQVLQYDRSGLSPVQLPDLNQGRKQHACSYFYNVDGEKNLIVAGGFGSNNYARSTEILKYKPDASKMRWTIIADLPHPMVFSSMVNLLNQVLIFGGNIDLVTSTLSDEVYMFDIANNQWVLQDRRMKSENYQFAASVVSLRDVCSK